MAGLLFCQEIGAQTKNLIFIACYKRDYKNLLYVGTMNIFMEALKIYKKPYHGYEFAFYFSIYLFEKYQKETVNNNNVYKNIKRCLLRTTTNKCDFQ